MRRVPVGATVMAAILIGQKPPASLQMGGKKSVTSFFITSRGLLGSSC